MPHGYIVSFSWTTGKSKALKIEIEDLHNENSTHEETMKLHESFTEAFAYMEERGYKMAGALRTSYIDGAWNQENPEQWLSVIQIPIE